MPVRAESLCGVLVDLEIDIDLGENLRHALLQGRKLAVRRLKFRASLDIRSILLQGYAPTKTRWSMLSRAECK